MSFTLSTIASDKVRRYSRANLRRRLEGDGFAVPRASVWINARESLTLRRKSEITGDGGVARDIEPVRAEKGAPISALAMSADGKRLALPLVPSVADGHAVSEIGEAELPGCRSKQLIHAAGQTAASLD